MNRFDKEFHGSDPISGRPFCSGYPDGIWMIGIILTLGAPLLAASIIYAVNSELREPDIATSLFTSLCIAYLTFTAWIASIILLIQRKCSIILLCSSIGFLSLVYSTRGLYLFYANEAHEMGNHIVIGLLFSIIFMAFAWYCEGLREDKIIGHLKSEKNTTHYLNALKKYAVFRGRARRSEYWIFILFNLIASLGIGIVESFFGSQGIAGLLYNLAVFIPTLAVSIRRLHDTDRSGWWILISFIPVIGAIVFIVFMTIDSNEGSNRFGYNPKAIKA